MKNRNARKSRDDKMTENIVWKVTTNLYYENGENDVIKIQQNPMSQWEKGVKV